MADRFHGIMLVSVCAFLLLAPTPALAQSTWYVDDNAPNDPGPGDPTVSDPAEDGSAAHPFDAIQEALNASVSGDEVIVADGTYTGVGNKELNYAGKDLNVHSENGPVSCIIDCESNGRGFLFDDGEPATAVVDGFTITNGVASYGGGIACDASSNPTIMNCIISGNTASSANGGGLRCDESSPSIINCIFTNNTATTNGGGLACQEGTSIITNCTIVGNDGGYGGGGAQIAIGSNVTITNCIFKNNTATVGPEIRLLGASNPSTLTISYTDVVGGQGAMYIYSSCTLNWGDGNIDADPLFIDEVGGDYRLTVAFSPCIDAGTNSPVGGLPSIDIDGNPRPIDGDGDVEPWSGQAETADMGAFETVMLTAPYICVSDDSIIFVAEFGGSNPDIHTLEIWNCGIGVLNWEVTEDCEWLTVEPTTGDSEGEVDIVNLDVDSTGLAIGEYDCELVVSDPAALNDPVIIPVTLRIALPAICVSHESVSFYVPEGETSPADQNLEIWNCDVGTLSWSVVEDCTWLDVNPLSGESAGEHDEIVLSVDATGLMIGEYQCVLEVVAPASSNSPVEVEVILSIYDPSEFMIFVDDDAPNDPGPGDPTVSDPLENGTAAHPFDSIQEAIDVADTDDTVIVADGTYSGVGNKNIEYNDKALTVRSANGPENCIIDCEGDGRGFWIHGGETADALLEGFTITNGYASWGGGIMCGSAATISNCIITDNTARLDGGGILCSDSAPTIVDCIISNNTAATDDGGGIWSSRGAPTIINCIIHGNIAADVYSHGGGIYCYSDEPILSNCVISGNSAGSGGGLELSHDCSATLTNCTIVSNEVVYGGGGVKVADGCNVTITNSICANNTATEGLEILLLGSSILSISYTDIIGGQDGVSVCLECTLNWDDGIIDADPLFTDAGNGDFHLTAGLSPCIDAGTNNPIGGLPSTDLDGNPRPIDGDGDVEPWSGQAATADMGAFEAGESTDPRICTTSDSVFFAAVYGEPNPESQMLGIWNCGVDVINWQITEDSEWLTVDPATGDSAGETDYANLDVDVSGLAMGDYECELVISDPAAVNNPVVVPVSLRVALPEICVSADEYTFHAVEGGAVPEDQTLAIWNCDIGTLSWSVVEDCAWLSADPTNGESQGEQDEVVLHVDSSGLATGDYHCVLEIVDPEAGNNPIAIEIALWIAPPSETSLYVDDAALIGGDGSTWATAFRYLQDAIRVAAAEPVSSEIRVAGGVYTPDQDEGGYVTPGNRGETFQLVDNLVIRGGYRGLSGGGDPDDRDIDAYETILSGDIGTPSEYDDNSYHVVTGSGVDATAELDGVTIAYGYTSQFAGEFDGGGIYILNGSPTLRDCTIRDNRTAYGPVEVAQTGGNGAGLYCEQGAPTLIGCVIENNSTHNGMSSWCEGGVPTIPFDGGSGGGLFFSEATPTLIGCLIQNNATGRGGSCDHCAAGGARPGADGGNGAGILLDSCPQATFINCVISGNITGEGREGADGDPMSGSSEPGSDGGTGAGIYINSSPSIYFINCAITDNTCGNGGDGGDSYDTGGYSNGDGGEGGDGGGVSLDSSQAYFVNCVITDNTTGNGGDGGTVSDGDDDDGGDAGFGAGIYSNYSTLSLTNCTFARNVTGEPGIGLADGLDSGGGFYGDSGWTTLANCILWQNEASGTIEQQQLIGGGITIDYSCVDGWTGDLGGTGNIGGDPLFVDWAIGDYRLTPGSACIDAGDSTAVVLDTYDIDNDGDTAERIPLDLDGLLRFTNHPGTADTGVADPPAYPQVVDMGAYEYGLWADLDGDCQIGLSDLAQLLASYGDTSGVGYSDGDLDGDGDVDLSDLAALLGVYGASCP